jgi:hypothetical protein
MCKKQQMVVLHGPQQPNNISYNSACIGDMADANTGWFVSGTVLCKTTNGGNNWIRNTDPYVTSTGWSSLFVFSKDIIYLKRRRNIEKSCQKC